MKEGLNVFGKLLYYIDKRAMVLWVRGNFNKSSPRSGNPEIANYLDFSEISFDSYDCTNFVSHAILAGGSPMLDPGVGGISSRGWYFRDAFNRSSSWSGVGELYNFIISNAYIGPTGDAVPYRNLDLGDDFFEEGDIIQFSNGSVWRHTGIITGFAPSLDGSGKREALITGRTSKELYNDDQYQSTIYPGLPRRIIRLRGFYR